MHGSGASGIHSYCESCIYLTSPRPRFPPLPRASSSSSSPFSKTPHNPTSTHLHTHSMASTSDSTSVQTSNSNSHEPLVINSTFNILSVDEADAAQCEVEYPAQESQDDNEVLDCIAFAPTMAMATITTPRQARCVGTNGPGTAETETETSGVENVSAQVRPQPGEGGHHRCTLCEALLEWLGWLQTHLLARERGVKKEESREFEVRKTGVKGEEAKG